ncbi:MAG TPA: hypothetical protein VH575_34830 [Gemmataceae bacterium]
MARAQLTRQVIILQVSSFFADLMTQQTQLSLDTRSVLHRVLTVHALDEGTDFLAQRRTPRPLRPGLPTPPQAEALPVPADDGVRLDHDERRAPTSVQLRQVNPEQPIAAAQRRSWPLPDEAANC